MSAFRQLDKLSVGNKLLLLLLIPICLQLISASVLTYFLLCSINQSKILDQTTGALIKAQCLQAKALRLSTTLARSAFSAQSDMATPIDRAISDIKQYDEQSKGSYQGAFGRETKDAVEKMTTEAISILQSAKLIYSREDIAFLDKNEQIKPFAMKAAQQARLLTPVVRKVDIFQSEALAANKIYTELALWLTALSLMTSTVTAYLAARAFSNSVTQKLKRVQSNALLLASDRPLPAPLDGSDEFALLDLELQKAHQLLCNLRQRQMLMLCRTGDVLCAIDANLKFSIVSPSALDCWGFDSEQLVGKAITSFIQNPDPFLELLKQLPHQDGFEEIETAIKIASGEKRYFVWTIKFDAAKSLYLCVARDITEVRRTALARQKLLAVASHDLRSPLMAMLFKISSIAKKMKNVLSNQTRLHLESAESDIKTLATLIENILSLEKITSTGLTGCSSLIDVVSATKEELTIELDKKAADITFNQSDLLLKGPENLFVAVFVQLIQTLLSSAKSGARILVQAKQTNSQLVLIFASNVNQPHYGADMDKTLTMTKQIIHALKGELDTVNNGFILRLPTYGEDP